MKRFIKILIISIMALALLSSLLACTSDDATNDNGENEAVENTPVGDDNAGDNSGDNADDNAGTIPDKGGIDGNENLFVFEPNAQNDGVILKSATIKQPVVSIPSESNGKPIKEIANEVFHASQIITEVTIPASVEKVGDRAFSSCYNLNKVTFENGSLLKSIGYRAFYNAEDLATINLPNGLTEVKEGAFDLCISLETLTFPSSLTTVGARAFHALWFDTQPNGLVTVSSVAYAYKGEEEVALTLPNTVTSVAEKAFYGNDKITSLYIPSTINYVGQNAFNNMVNLESISLTDNQIYGVESGCLMEIESKKVIATTIGATIPNTTKILANECFAYNTSLSEVVVPSSVTTIEKGAFKGSSITKITLPNTIEVIEEDLFLDCQNLSSVNIPSSILEIKSASFNGCPSLTEIIIDNDDILELCIGKLNSPAGLMAYAEIVYVNENVETTSSYLVAFFSQTTSDKVGYNKFVINP